MKKLVLGMLPLVVLMLAGWAKDYNPAVDLKGKDQKAYQNDLAECRKIAQNKDIGNNAAVATGVGVGLGAASGAIFGGGYGAATGAASGGLNSGSSAALSTSDQQDRIVDDCLRHRGYTVY